VEKTITRKRLVPVCVYARIYC